MSPSQTVLSVHRSAAKKSAPVRLSDLRRGATARFEEARLSAQDSAVLGAIGLTGACRLRVCKAGDPFIVQVRGTRIGLSRSVARGIFVVPDTAS